jgi:hypothetical protein
MPPEPDEDDLCPGDAVTAAEFTGPRGLDRHIVNRWRERGYLDSDGNRVYVQPRGHIRRGTRTYPVYLVTDLAAAELATRGKGGHNRRDTALAVSQRAMRAQRRQQAA